MGCPSGARNPTEALPGGGLQLLDLQRAAVVQVDAPEDLEV